MPIILFYNFIQIENSFFTSFQGLHKLACSSPINKNACDTFFGTPFSGRTQDIHYIGIGHIPGCETAIKNSCIPQQ